MIHNLKAMYYDSWDSKDSIVSVIFRVKFLGTRNYIFMYEWDKNSD